MSRRHTLTAAFVLGAALLGCSARETGSQGKPYVAADTTSSTSSTTTSTTLPPTTTTTTTTTAPLAERLKGASEMVEKVCNEEFFGGMPYDFRFDPNVPEALFPLIDKCLSDRSAAAAEQYKREQAAETISMDEFERIADGMTYEQVVAIVGSPGSHTSTVTIGGSTAESYTWRGTSSYSSASVTFTNGLVASKWQVGLDS